MVVYALYKLASYTIMCQISKSAQFIHYNYYLAGTGLNIEVRLGLGLGLGIGIGAPILLVICLIILKRCWNLKVKQGTIVDHTELQCIRLKDRLILLKQKAEILHEHKINTLLK